MENFRDKRTGYETELGYKHPEWIRGNLYENIDVRCTRCGHIYLADAFHNLVDIKSGYIWNLERQFEGSRWKDISDDVWLLIVPKKKEL